MLQGACKILRGYPLNPSYPSTLYSRNQHRGCLSSHPSPQLPCIGTILHLCTWNNIHAEYVNRAVDIKIDA